MIKIGVKVARRGPSLVFYCSYTNNVEVKILVQLCKGFTNEQIVVAMASKFVAMATLYEVKDTLFFYLLRLIT